MLDREQELDSFDIRKKSQMNFFYFADFALTAKERSNLVAVPRRQRT